MAIGINQSVSTRGLTQTRSILEKTFSQLSSARRINSAGDDAAGLAISENLRAVERALDQGERNLSDGISVAQTAAGGLSQATEIAGRLRELSLQAQNGTTSDAGKQAIQAEFDQLTSELTRIAESTQFNGQTLLNGDTSGTGALTVRDGTAGGDVVQISIGDTTASGLGLEGLQADDGATLDSIDAAISRISSERASLGSTENRLRSGINNLRSIRENTTAAESRIRDTDFAKATAENTRAQIQQQVGTAVQAQANINSGLALALLS